jgi:membrane protease subunit HflC
MHMPASESAAPPGGRHVPTLLLGAVVAAVFLVSIFSFQVRSTESVVVTTFGKPREVNEPGLHFRWPAPIQLLTRFDSRSRSFDGSIGKIEETYTADGKNLTVGIFVVYRISDPVRLFRSVKTVEEAEARLNDFMRNSKNGVLGSYRFSDLVNTDPGKMKLDEVEKRIHEEIAGAASEQLGIEVERVGIKSLGLPEKISEAVFARMRSEREVAAETYRAQGRQAADEIRAATNQERDAILTDAQAAAKRIRAEGDAQSAAYYAVFREEPELAAFLRKLDSLRRIMPNRTTLILDTNTPPFDLLKLDAEKLRPRQAVLPGTPAPAPAPSPTP